MLAVLVLCLAGVAAVSMQVRCVDAAREAARLAARGDNTSADTAARGLAPAGATVDVSREGGFVRVRVSGRSPLLPGLRIAAEAVAAVEPGR